MYDRDILNGFQSCCTTGFRIKCSVSLSEQNGFCHVNSSQLTAHIQSYTNVTSGDAEALKLALFKNGPAAVSIDASHRSFVFYSHGVYYEPACGRFTSH